MRQLFTCVHTASCATLAAQRCHISKLSRAVATPLFTCTLATSAWYASFHI